MTHPDREISKNVTVQQNVGLKPYNTLGIDAVANSFIEVTDQDTLGKLYKEGFFSDQKFPIILGGGSNVLLKGDPKSPVLKISIPGIRVTDESDHFVRIEAGAGVNWHELVTWAVERNFGGIENLALIPGTTGAAPIQNIGAYGVELSDTFESLRAFLPESGEFNTFYYTDCEFGYRDSIFKRELKGKAIITGIVLKLRKSPHRINDSYYALKNHFNEAGVSRPVIRDVYDAVVSIRRSKLPDPSVLGNAGSFFKNPVVDKSFFETLEKRYPEMPSFPAGDGLIKIPAGWLIEQAGWKGKRIGNVGTYRNQALVIVNHGDATGEEIFGHAIRIQKSVQQKFDIELVPEVNILE
ncbi:MAG: UDP-N-acetylmuramate dehydrogenase [Balneolaceae bacterium]|nr:UDP-N-acetylmuramate dehydrogenase [Balneolaceae bacterium]